MPRQIQLAAIALVTATFVPSHTQEGLPEDITSVTNDDKDRVIVGSWEVISYKINARDDPGMIGAILTFSEDGSFDRIIERSGQSFHNYRIDDATAPRQLSHWRVTHVPGVDIATKGIYKIIPSENMAIEKLLVICETDEDRPLPEAFESLHGKQHVLMILKPHMKR